MKKHLISALFLALAVCAGAQEKTPQKAYERAGKTFIQSSRQTAGKTDSPTAYTWKDKQGKEYPIILHTYTKGEKKGRTTAYVVRTSAKTGKEYKYYLPDGERIALEIMNETK